MRAIWLSFLALLLWLNMAAAQDGPLRIKITQGVIEPLKFAIPEFEADEGIGEAWIFNDNSRLEAVWSKDNLTAPTVFSDKQGNIVQFSQGSSWVLFAKSGSVTILEK